MSSRIRVHGFIGLSRAAVSFVQGHSVFFLGTKSWSIALGIPLGYFSKKMREFGEPHTLQKKTFQFLKSSKNMSEKRILYYPN